MAHKLPSKIFIDGGVVSETRDAVSLLGYLDGQTTNPSLIAKNLASTLGGKVSAQQATQEYKKIVMEISQIIPQGSVSIQVFANRETTAQEMIEQARDRITWIPNASIKLPCTMEGLKAAEVVCEEMPINITLCFSQAQAAAVYEATKIAAFPVFISPFVGRLDDRGENGMQLIENIIKMYSMGDGHVEVLTASVRTLDHILFALKLGSDIITIPYKMFTAWSQKEFLVPHVDYVYPSDTLKALTYQDDIELGKIWSSYDLHHDLTDKGVDAFWSDWSSIVL